MTHYQRHVPDLAAALDRLADEHVYIHGPDIDGRASKWLPCSCSCGRVDAMPLGVVSYTCSDCAESCEVCSLPMFEHDRDAEGLIHAT